VELLSQRDFWFRYQAVHEDHRLDAEHHFVLPWNDRFGFELHAGPSAITLSLVECVSEQRHVLGWWDEARWHPFALRWSELRMLVAAWANRSDVLAAPAPLLLLGRFCGFGGNENEQHEEARRCVADAYRGLGFAAEDVSELTTHSLPRPDEADYRWTRDAELGWLFGGEYACYSLRNREHLPGKEGRFPFAHIQKLFADETGGRDR
jgi:hypothetical protein